MSEDRRVRITCHDGFLVIDTLKPQEDEWFVPAGGSRIGCVLLNTEKHLEMSDKAFELLKTMKGSYDDIGDVSTWEVSENGYQCISWLGPTKRIVNVAKSESSREGILSNLKYKKIKNYVPPEAFEAIVRAK
jgi:hypothetical protein